MAPTRWWSLWGQDEERDNVFKHPPPLSLFFIHFVNSPGGFSSFFSFTPTKGWRWFGDGDAHRWDVSSGRRCCCCSCGEVRDADGGANLSPDFGVIETQRTPIKKYSFFFVLSLQTHHVGNKRWVVIVVLFPWLVCALCIRVHVRNVSATDEGTRFYPGCAHSPPKSAKLQPLARDVCARCWSHAAACAFQ